MWLYGHESKCLLLSLSTAFKDPEKQESGIVLEPDEESGIQMASGEG